MRDRTMTDNTRAVTILEAPATPGDPLLLDVAALVAAMREVGVTGDGTWFEQEFRAVERQLVERGLILPWATS